LHTWTFNLKGKSHRIDFWDSRISGKKKLALDGNELKKAKDIDNFYYPFIIDGYNFTIIQKSDEKFEIQINNRNFTDLLKDERIGKLQRDKEEYYKKKGKENKKNNYKNKNEDDYYKRAMKYNGEDYFEGEEEMYDIEEQRKRLEEFEKKKQEKFKENSKKNNYNDDDDAFYDNKNRNNGKKNLY
jgi:hypothetical protein